MDEGIERQLCLLAERQPRTVGEDDLQPRRFSGRHDLVEKDGRPEGKRLGRAAMRSARLSLDAADGADRLLRCSLAAGEGGK
jgi:hypothetical protein